jgi:hypothetical protein
MLYALETFLLPFQNIWCTYSYFIAIKHGIHPVDSTLASRVKNLYDNAKKKVQQKIQLTQKRSN